MYTKMIAQYHTTVVKITCLAMLGNYTAGINLIHVINNQVAIIYFSLTKEYNFNLLDWSISNGIAMPM